MKLFFRGLGMGSRLLLGFNIVFCLLISALVWGYLGIPDKFPILLSISLPLAILSFILIAIPIIRHITIPLKQLSDILRTFTLGEEQSVTLPVTSSDEVGGLIESFNQFMEKLHVFTQNAKDQLWLQTCHAELNRRIRGEQDVEELCSNVINYMGRVLNAQTGVIYTVDSDGQLHFAASFALPINKSLQMTFRPGEGLVGQAMLLKEPLTVESVPESYGEVYSGTGRAVPANLIIFPYIFDERVKCVVELGSFSKFTATQIKFLEEISSTVAISINSAQIRSQMQNLLDKTIKQKEELKAKQEELEQYNIALEEKTIALKESEAYLLHQHEELQLANQELEKRAKILEDQKAAIHEKNENLKKIKLEIEKKAQELELANKYKSEFLANVSHELRTPLNSILVLSKILADKTDNSPLTDKQLEFAQTIHSSGKDLLELINDILDLSKIESGKMDMNLEALNLHELGQYVKDTFGQIAKDKNLEFVVEVADDLPEIIHSDSQKVKQIVRNLLSNALKFTEQGRVSCKIARPEVNAKFLRSNLGRGKVICISVADTGIGIPEDKHEFIFEAFRQLDGTTSRKYDGTGLGLTITRDLATLLGGEIHLQSKVGVGSTFTIFLPEEIGVVEEAAPTAEELQTPNQSIPLVAGENKDSIDEDGERKLVLVIEDDEKFAKLLLSQAREKGLKALVARNGETGLKFAEYYAPLAIILDINLPGINGWDVLERLKKNPRTAGIPVHIITATEEMDTELIAESASFLQKPVSVETLNGLFSTIDGMPVKRVSKKLLIAVSDLEDIRNITALMTREELRISAVVSGEEAYHELKSDTFDCMILDLELEDLPGIDLVRKLEENDIACPPTVMYTAKELSAEDRARLVNPNRALVTKGNRSITRLVTEAELFLHQLNSNLKENISQLRTYKPEIFYRRKILIVDDDMRNVFALSSLLEEKNVQVLVGRNGQEGLTRLKQNPDVDLVIMDIMMPVMDGYTAMKEIRAIPTFEKLPIVTLTAKAMLDDRKKCFDAGASDYLEKPVEAERLFSILAVWLEK